MLTCPICGDTVPEYYQGAIRGICYGCWVDEWESVIKYKAMAGKDWTPTHVMLLMLSQGYTRGDVCEVVGQTRKRIRKVLHLLKNNREDVYGFIKEICQPRRDSRIR